ncbi:hypothetical protein [Desulfogranum japonicum]|nr:hypothetical protein [Desulfogranum japonicum]
MKKQYPNWTRLSRKTKKVIAVKVLSIVVAEYDFSHKILNPHKDLLGLE